MKINCAKKPPGRADRWLRLAATAVLCAFSVCSAFAAPPAEEKKVQLSLDGIVLNDLQENQSPELFEKLFGTSLSSRPAPQSGPTIIFYGVEVEEVRVIEAAARRYYVRGFLWTYWRDPRVKIGEDLLKNLHDTRRESPSIKWSAKPLREKKLVWDPELDFVNADRDLEVTMETIEVFPPKAGHHEEVEVEYWCRFSGWFSDQADMLDFRNFPFDRQKLVVDIATSYSADQIEFRRCWELNEDDIERLSSRLSHPEWIFKSVDIGNTAWSYVAEGNTRFSVGRTIVTAQRKPQFYAINLGIPIAIILLLFNCLLWIQRREFAAKLGGMITCLLSLVAFSLVVNAEVPKIPYMTVFGKSVLAAFVIITCGAILTVIDHLSVPKKERYAGATARNTPLLRYGAAALNICSAGVIVYFAICWLGTI